MSRSLVVIVSPALAAANNGNWQTARRWAQLLAPHHAVRIAQRWPEADGADAVASAASTGDAQGDCLLALHARRSAASIQAWAHLRGNRGLAVVLTGTDLYKDIHTDEQARQSLRLAQQLVVLQERGLQALPAALRGKARVIYQSTSGRAPISSKPTRWLRAVMVGHLRTVKSPQTLFEAARLLAGHPDIHIDHIGAAADPGETGEPDWAAQARATQAANPRYRWLGGLPHEATRRAIQRAHLLVHTSAMEGGAHVIMEAVRSGTPVLASRVDGNVGMLGEDYAGYFEHGDAAALAGLLSRCRAEQLAHIERTGSATAATANAAAAAAATAIARFDPTATLLDRLHAQCEARASLFAPAAERAALLQLIDDLLKEPTP